MNKKDIDFLQELEMKIFKSTKNGIINESDYRQFYNIVDKLKTNWLKRNKNSRELIREKRKYDKNYAR